MSMGSKSSVVGIWVHRLATRRALLAAVAGIGLVAGRASAETWDNSSTDFDWDTPTNWNPDGVPGAGSTALFSSNAAGVIGTIDLEGLSQTIDALQFTHTSGQYTIGTAVGDGTITLNQLMKTGAGNLTLNSNLTAAGSTLTLNTSNQTTLLDGKVTTTNLVKGGDNNLTLRNVTNAISGTVTINSGTLEARGVGTLGASAVTLAGGTLNLRSLAATPNPLVWGTNVSVNSSSTISVDVTPSTSGTGITQSLGTLTIGGSQLSFGNGSGQRLTFTGTTLVGNATFQNAGGISLGALNDGGVARTISVTGGNSNNGGFVLDTAASSLTAGGVINLTQNSTVTLAAANAWNSTINAINGRVQYNVANALAGVSTISATGASNGSNSVGQVVVANTVNNFGDDLVSISAGNVLQINSTSATGLTRGTNLTLATGAIVAETAANQLTIGTPIANLGTANDLMFGLSNGIQQSLTVGNAGGTTPWMGISTDSLSDRDLQNGSIVTVATAAGATSFTLQGVNNQRLTVANTVKFVSPTASTANLVGRIALAANTTGAYDNITLQAKAGSITSSPANVSLTASNALPGAIALNVEGATATGSAAQISSVTSNAINGPINLLSGAAANLSGGSIVIGNNNLFSTTTQGSVTLNVGALGTITQQQAINNGPGTSANEVILATDNSKPYQGPIVQINTNGLTGTGQIGRTGTGSVIWQLMNASALSGSQFTPASIAAGDIVRLSADNIVNLSNVTGAAIYEVINDRTENSGSNSNINLNGGMLVTDAGNRVMATAGGINIGSGGGTIGAPNGSTFRISSPVIGGSHALTLGVNAVIDPIQQNSTTKIKNGLIRFNTDGVANTVTAGAVTLAYGSAQFNSGANVLGSYTSNSTGTTYASNGTTGSAVGSATIQMNAGTLATGGNAGFSTTGTIAGPVTAGTGAHTIAPGDLNGLGTLNLTNPGTSLSLNGFSTLNFDVNGFTEVADLLALTGTLDVGSGTPSITLGVVGVLDSPSYVLATFATSSVTASSFNLPVAPTGYVWSVSANSIALTVGTAVPEPATLSLLAIGATGLLCRRRTSSR